MREVVRCIHCKLNQFVTVSGLCRKCHKVPVFVPEPVAVEGMDPVMVEEPKYTAALTPITRAFPVVIRACRAGREYSQRDLAKEMAVPRTYISKIEIGRCTPTLASFLNFARGLNLSPRFILEMAEAMASA